MNRKISTIPPPRDQAPKAHEIRSASLDFSPKMCIGYVQEQMTRAYPGVTPDVTPAEQAARDAKPTALESMLSDRVRVIQGPGGTRTLVLPGLYVWPRQEAKQMHALSHNTSSPLSLNEKEAAKAIGVSVRTLQGWRFRRRGPAYAKLGRRVVYSVPDLEAFLRRHTVNLEGGNHA